jgi:hypothetical protein
MDALIIVCVVYLAECFDKVGEEAQEIIDGDFEDKKKRFKKLIDLHSKLIEYHKEVEPLFGFVIFVVITLTSMAVCILGFMAVYVSK